MPAGDLSRRRLQHKDRGPACVRGRIRPESITKDFNIDTVRVGVGKSLHNNRPPFPTNEIFIFPQRFKAVLMTFAYDDEQFTVRD